MTVDQEALCDLLEGGLLVTQGRPPEHCCAGCHAFFSPRRTDRREHYSLPQSSSRDRVRRTSGYASPTAASCSVIARGDSSSSPATCHSAASAPVSPRSVSIAQNLKSIPREVKGLRPKAAVVASHSETARAWVGVTVRTTGQRGRSPRHAPSRYRWMYRSTLRAKKRVPSVPRSTSTNARSSAS